MKLFKSIDERINDLGYEKEEENDYGVTFSRPYLDGKHVVYIGRKWTGIHILQSYDSNLFDEKSIGNVCVGLTYKELKLFTKKMKQMVRKWKGVN